MRMRMVYASWNSLGWLLTTNQFASTGTDVKVILKFATILFSYFLLTKIGLVQRVKLLILLKRIGCWDVMFVSNDFTNTALRFKIQQYISKPFIVFLRHFYFNKAFLRWLVSTNPNSLCKILRKISNFTN